MHMSDKCEFFDSFNSFGIPVKVIVGDGKILKAISEDRIDVEINNETHYLEKECFVADLCKNLLSVGPTTMKGYEFRADVKG